MYVLALLLSLPNDRDLFVDDVVRGHGVGGHEQHKDIASPKLLLDFRVPVRPARHVAINPKIENSVLYCWLKVTLYEAEPLNLTLSRLLGFVPMAVTYKNDRFGRLARHDRIPGQLPIEATSGVACQHMST